MVEEAEKPTSLRVNEELKKSAYFALHITIA
jgi:hypothetical protein